ncbi:MAG: hypothetical protein ACREXJ_05845 [Gammaproteobacteria bacterium]
MIDKKARVRRRRYLDTGMMVPDELRAWILARRVAQARERREWMTVREPPADAIRLSLSLIVLAARLQGWPPPEDPVTRREDEVMYERWRRLRARMTP